MGSRVIGYGPRLRVKDLGSKVKGARAKGSRVRDQVLQFRGQEPGFKVNAQGSKVRRKQREFRKWRDSGEKK